MNSFLWQPELEQIYHSSRLHQTLKEAGKEIKQRLQVTEKKEVGSQLPPHCVALHRVRLFLSPTSDSLSTTAAAHPQGHHPAHLAEQALPQPRPLYYSRQPHPTGKNRNPTGMGRLQEDHSYCSMTLYCSSG